MRFGPVVATSDWHGDARTHGKPRFAEIERAVLKSRELAAVREASLYVFAGDLCDPDSGQAATDSIELAVDTALWLASRKIPSLWVRGNHDVSEGGSGGSTLSPLRPLNRIANLVGFAPVIDTFAGRCRDNVGIKVADGPVAYMPWPWLEVRALPYPSTSSAYDAATFLREPTPPAFRKATWRLVVSHLSVPGIVPGEETSEMPRGREVLLPLDALEEACGDAVVIQGHYHRRQTFRPEGRPRCPAIHVLGSLARLTHGDEDHEPAINVFELE